MALRITEDCIACTACERECPNSAIALDAAAGRYRIDPGRCTECVGFYEASQCAAVCPVGACVAGGGGQGRGGRGTGQWAGQGTGGA